MKRLTVLIVLLLFVLSSFAVFPSPALSVQPKVVFDGNTLLFDVPPIIENGRTLVPVRAIFEKMSVMIDWDNKTKTLSAGKGDIAMAVQVGNPLANVNNSPVILDTPPKIVNGRTMVPLRFISETFGFKVGWDPNTATISITSGGGTAKKQ